MKTIKLLNKTIYDIVDFIEGTSVDIKEIKFSNTNKGRLATLKYKETFESKFNARSMKT
jgi:hypothetical protein